MDRGLHFYQVVSLGSALTCDGAVLKVSRSLASATKFEPFMNNTRRFRVFGIGHGVACVRDGIFHVKGRPSEVCVAAPCLPSTL